MPRFYTNEYKRSHGKEPRGWGQWAFAFGFDDSPVFAPGPQSFTVARNWARIEARVRGVDHVRVLP